MKNNLSLIVLGVALLGVYLVGNLQNDFDSSDKLFGEKFLTGINSISLKKSSDEIILSKAVNDLRFGLDKEIYKGQWVISGPNLSAPNIESLNKFFYSISHLKILHKFDSQSVKEFGLEQPQAILKLISTIGERTVKLGSTNQITKRRYAQIEGSNKILLVDEGEIANLLKLELRDLKPLKIASQNIAKISIEGSKSIVFERTDGQLKVKEEKNLDSSLMEQYLDSIISMPAVQTVSSDKIADNIKNTITLDWADSEGVLNHTKIELHSSEGGNFILKLPGAPVGYEFGPEFGRLLSRELETFYNKKLLRSVQLEDFFGSCPDLTIKAKCQVDKARLDRIQESLQRVEVLYIERLSGRLMTPTKPECRLKLGSARVQFEVGGKVNGEVSEATESPRFFVSDSGPEHYRGVISGVVAKEFCQTIEKLCIEAKASCAG